MSSGLIAWVGGEYFKLQHATERGYEVIHFPMERPIVWTWENIVKGCGREPDYVLYADCSMPPPLIGIEDFPCPTLFYAIDSHIHSWQPMYAQAFDFAAISLRDHMPRFRQRLDNDHVIWLPPFPIHDEYPLEPQPAKKWDVLFAGNVDKDTTPERHLFLKELKARFPGLEVRQGVLSEIFPRARLILNIAEHGDLNFHIFEALAARSCLITPEVGHGQSLLFTNRKHLVTYTPDDVDGLVDIICELLDNKELREAVAEAGHAEINTKHRPAHRANTLFNALDTLDDATVQQRLKVSQTIRTKYLKLVYLHWADAYCDTDLGRKYLTAAKRK